MKMRSIHCIIGLIKSLGSQMILYRWILCSILVLSSCNSGEPVPPESAYRCTSWSLDTGPAQ